MRQRGRGLEEGPGSGRPNTCHLEGESDGSPGARSLFAAAAWPGAVWAMMDSAFLPLKDSAGLM